MSIDFRENIDPVCAKIFAKMESKMFAKIVRKSQNNFSKMSENFRGNFRGNQVSRFSLETLNSLQFSVMTSRLRNSSPSYIYTKKARIREFLHLYELEWCNSVGLYTSSQCTVYSSELYINRVLTRLDIRPGQQWRRLSLTATACYCVQCTSVDEVHYLTCRVMLTLCRYEKK